MSNFDEMSEPKPATLEPMLSLLSPLTENWPLARVVPVDEELLKRLVKQREVA